MPSPNVILELREPGRFVLRLGVAGIVLFLVLGIEFLAVSSSLLLGALIVSRIFAARSLEGLHASVTRIQPRARCGETLSARLRLSNHNTLLPVFFPTLDLAAEGDTSPQSFRYDRLIRAGETAELEIDLIARARGAQTVKLLGARSRFPFAFSEALSDTQASSPEIVVWPRLAFFDLSSVFKERPSYALQSSGDQHADSPTIEVSRIRDYELGDPRRAINWKLTARRDKLTVIEARENKEERFELHLDTSATLWQGDFQFERMLSIVSSIVPELWRRRCLRGITINKCFYPAENPRQISRIFDALSLAQPTDELLETPEETGPRTLWIVPDAFAGIALSPSFEALSKIQAHESA